MYIHGTDFSSYNAQALAKQIASGLNLQVPSFGSGVTNLASEYGDTGNGIAWVTQLMYVGPTTGTLCSSVGASNCTNASSFVYTQQIIFGKLESHDAEEYDGRESHGRDAQLRGRGSNPSRIAMRS